MRHKIRHTIKLRISLITVSFSLIIVVFLSTLSFTFFQDYARRSIVQSTEFNLQLIAGMFGQKLTELDMLSKWCVVSTQMAEWLDQESPGAQNSILIYDRLKEVIWNNRSNGYIRRLIVTDAAVSKLLQAGSNMSDSWPVTIYNLPRLGLAGIDAPRVYRECAEDPYAIGEQEQVIPVVRPIRRPGSSERIGYVYLAISADALLDQLINYHMPEDCSLYLTLGDATYRLEKGNFIDISDRIVSSSARKETTLSPQTVVSELRMDKGGTSLLVGCPTGIEGAFLSQSLSARRISAERRLYVLILALISVAVLLFGLLISFLLSRIITRPVLKLRRKIDAISESDFRSDPGIEWDDELGDIGRGINDMSGKIVSLLENRLADEKKKRDLEYRMLQSQINPHFLYNTLNTIKWMATIQNATGIAELTTALSRLMKNVIKGSRTMVTLKEEFAFLDDYFLIQRYRYGGAIVFEKTLSHKLERVSIPCFSLQPLMENAIFHGIEPKGGTGRISLSVERRRGVVEIVMEDDGIGMSAEKIRGVLSDEEPADPPGLFREIGIASVDKRIKHSCGSGYGLDISSEPGLFTRPVLSVPYILLDAPPPPDNASPDEAPPDEVA